MNSTLAGHPIISDIASTAHVLTRRGRIQRQVETWKSMFPILQDVLNLIKVPKRACYRRKIRRSLFQERVRSRSCLNTGINVDNAMVSIASKIDAKPFPLCYYQEQYKQAATTAERAQAYVHLVTETMLALRDEFPEISAEMMTEPRPWAVLAYWILDRMYRFEIHIIPSENGSIDFRSYRYDWGIPKIVTKGKCNEEALPGMRRDLRENTERFLMDVSDEYMTANLRKEELEFVTRVTGRNFL